MKNKNNLKANAKISKTVKKTVDGKPNGGYVEVIVTVGTQWKRIFFSLDSKKTGTKESK